MQRIRVIRELTDYIRFEMGWGYPPNVAAGEDIRIFELKAGNEALPVEHDFWLFDDRIAVRMDYTSDGAFIGPVEATNVETYRRARDLLLRWAVPFREYRPSLFI